MTTVYAEADPSVFIDELRLIFPEHYDELCVTKDFPLDPDLAVPSRSGEIRSGLPSCAHIYTYVSIYAYIYICVYAIINHQ